MISLSPERVLWLIELAMGLGWFLTLCLWLLIHRLNSIS